MTNMIITVTFGPNMFKSFYNRKEAFAWIDILLDNEVPFEVAMYPDKENINVMV